MPLARFTIRMRLGGSGARSGHRTVAQLPNPDPRRSDRNPRHGNGRRKDRSNTMNAYDVLFDHHNVLRGLCKKITGLTPTSDERQATLDQLLVELDIHMRIEDDLFYPAVQAATKLVAIAHAEHRQVFDQLTVVLRTSPAEPEYEAEWNAFVTVLDAHADEEERDLIPPPVDLDER